MTEERITTTRVEAGNTHTTRVVTDGEASSGGGGAKWVSLLILGLAIAAAVYVFSQTSAAEITKDNAITEAAGEVGEAAGQIGDAAEGVADEVTGEE